MVINIPKVEDVMNKEVVYATLPGTRDEVLNILKNKKISAVPVMKEGKVIGIVSRTNILKNPEEEHLALLMTRNPLSINIGDSLIDAASLLYKNNIQILPVIDTYGKIKGLITTKDIINVISNSSIELTIENYFKKKVYTLWENTPISIAVYQMDLINIKTCPVIDNYSNISGMISNEDIIESSIIEDRTEKSDMSSGQDEDLWTWESMRNNLNIYYSVSKVRFPKEKLVKDLMIKKVIYATSSSNVSDCARKMKRNKINQIPIVDLNNKIKGILRDQDLLKPLIDMNNK